MRATKVLSPTDTGASRTHQSGMLIPKDQRILRLFPRLDISQPNPDRELVLRVEGLGMHWPARFVFYNSKDLGTGTRSEYRLTRIAGLLREIGAVPGDRLTFEKDAFGDLVLHHDSAHVSGDLGSVVTLRSGWTIEVS